MEDEKKEEKRGYTFSDKRGRSNEDDALDRQEMKKDPVSEHSEQEPSPKDPSLLIDFVTLIMSFASASMICMGKIPDPATGTVQKNLSIAKQNIDIISLLMEKTKGNLTQEEDRIIEQILYELRMHYVEAAKGPQ